MNVQQLTGIRFFAIYILRKYMKILDKILANKIFILAGFAIILISFSADLIGVGDTNIKKIGPIQWLGVGFGLGIIILGKILSWYRTPLQKKRPFFHLRQQWQKQWSTTNIFSRPSNFVLTTFCILLILWQSTFTLASDKLDRTYLNGAASGMGFQYSFVYFYYYKNIYPVFSAKNDVFYFSWQKMLNLPVITEFEKPEYSAQAADDLFNNHPDTLLMDLGWTIRPGDDGKTLLFLPETILRGTPEGAGVNWFLSWVFILSLLSLLVASYYTGYFLLGVFLVAFLGSHPFQLAEIYGKGYITDLDGITWATGQVFSIPISITILLLAFYLPLIFNVKVSKYYLWSLPIISGVVIGSARQVRGENVGVIFSILLCYILINCIPWRKKFLMMSLVVISFLLTSQSWSIYFNYKFAQASQIVKNVGGHPLSVDDKLQYHPFWSTIMAGLGDFDLSKGYAWNDYVIYDYVCPILESQGELEGRACRDFSEIYVKVPWTIPAFETISRDKVLGDIVSDPIWYLDILYKRLQRILTDVTPPRLGIGAHYFDIPVSSGILIPLFILLAIVRKWPYLKLIVFTLPLATGALIIYSGKGTTYYSIFLQIGIAICCFGLLRGIVWAFRD